MKEILIMTLGFHAYTLLDDTAICGNREEDGILLSEKRINLVFEHAGFNASLLKM